MWTVRSRIEWTDPVTEEEFEHDVSGGRVGATIMVVVLFVLLLAFIVLTPSNVVFPGWLAFAMGLLVLFFPLRWMARRPWTLIAETLGGTGGLPAERWVGMVRGFFSARSEVGRARRHLRSYNVPDRYGDGPLNPVN